MSLSSDLVVDVRDAFCLHQVPDGAVVALRGLTLGVRTRERVVVHGPNGSGKTTLLRLLAGEQPLAAGRAVVAGADVGTGGELSAGRRWRTTRLGWIDQNPWRTLRPELDVLGNVVLQQRLAGVDEATARAGAGPLLERLAVSHLARRRPESLSGGEAQRVAVCAALAHGPRLVLADEPTGELDAETALEVYDALADAVRAAGAALVLVSHDRRAARVADRVVRIRDGRLSETWSPGRSSGDRHEWLVVDDRGWVRLPDTVRGAGLQGVRAELGPRGLITLRPRGFGDGEDPGTRSLELAPEPELPAPAVRSAGAEADVLARLVGVGRGHGIRSVLEGVDCEIRAGRLFVVRGPSGAGKSTLLRVMIGLEPADEGSVLLGGRELAALDREERATLRRGLVSYCGQDVQLAETLDAAANLDLARTVRGLPRDDALVARALSLVDLAGLSTRAARELSGGERQRLAVARGLAVGPRLLVCDEPSSQLDEAAGQRLAHVLVTTAHSGAAVVVATHDPVLIEAADDVLDLT